MIWAQAAHEPRTVNIFRLNEDCASHSSVVEEQTTHPGIVHACSESRKEALKHYQEHSQMRRLEYQHETDFLCRRSVFINFSVDIFLLAVPITITFSAALGYSRFFAFNLPIDAIRNINNIEVEFHGSGNRSSFPTSFVLTRFLSMFDRDARLASVQVTFSDATWWYGMEKQSFVLNDMRRQRTTEEYRKHVSEDVRKGLVMPELQFVWKISEDKDY